MGKLTTKDENFSYLVPTLSAPIFNLCVHVLNHTTRALKSFFPDP